MDADHSYAEENARREAAIQVVRDIVNAVALFKAHEAENVVYALMEYMRDHEGGDHWQSFVWEALAEVQGRIVEYRLSASH